MERQPSFVSSLLPARKSMLNDLGRVSISALSEPVESESDDAVFSVKTGLTLSG